MLPPPAPPLHATQLPLATMTVMDSSLQHDRIYGSSAASTLMVTVSAGYFMHDLIVCSLRLHIEGPTYLLHASCAFAVFSYGVYSGAMQYYGEVVVVP